MTSLSDYTLLPIRNPRLRALPRLQVVVLLPQPLDIDLQLGLLLGRLIEQLACGGQFLLIDRLQVGGLPVDGVLGEIQFLGETTVLVLQVAHAIDVAGQTIVQVLQFLLLLDAGGAGGRSGRGGAQPGGGGGPTHRRGGGGARNACVQCDAAC